MLSFRYLGYQVSVIPSDRWSDPDIPCWFVAFNPPTPDGSGMHWRGRLRQCLTMAQEQVWALARDGYYPPEFAAVSELPAAGSLPEPF